MKYSKINTYTSSFFLSQIYEFAILYACVFIAVTERMIKALWFPFICFIVYFSLIYSLKAILHIIAAKNLIKSIRQLRLIGYELSYKNLGLDKINDINVLNVHYNKELPKIKSSKCYHISRDKKIVIVSLNRSGNLSPVKQFSLYHEIFHASEMGKRYYDYENFTFFRLLLCYLPLTFLVDSYLHILGICYFFIRHYFILRKYDFGEIASDVYATDIYQELNGSVKAKNILTALNQSFLREIKKKSANKKYLKSRILGITELLKIDKKNLLEYSANTPAAQSILARGGLTYLFLQSSIQIHLAACFTLFFDYHQPIVAENFIWNYLVLSSFLCFLFVFLLQKFKSKRVIYELNKI